MDQPAHASLTDYFHMARTHKNQPIIAVLLFLVCAGVMAGNARGQDNPVYVNDSPAALAMYRQAQGHMRDNPGEAVRLFQAQLDEYPMKLVPVADRATDHFISVRKAVLRELRSDALLLERYRSFATPEAQRMLASGEYERLAVTRPLTEPGLQAMLRLAQDDLESANFDGAMIWLRQAIEHPDFKGELPAHAWYMTAIASHYLDDILGFDRAKAQLDQLVGAPPELTAQLNEIAGEPDGPRLATGVNALTQSRLTSVDELIAQPIWSSNLNQSLLHRRVIDPAIPEIRQSPVLEQHRKEADLQTSAATICGDVVYVSEGFRITAFDRYMGDRLWRYIDTSSMALIDSNSNDRPLDMNLITVSGSALVTYTGHAYSDRRSGAGSVLCLDRKTGEKRWETKLSDIAVGEDVEELFPQGQPIVEGGTVFVLARKVSRQRLASSYAIALDLKTGRQRWARYITSSAGLNRAGRPISSPAYKDGWLYIADPIGAIARVDAATGEIDWLRRFSVPINAPFRDESRRPWEFSAPVVTSAGLIAMQPDQRRIGVFDIHTGETLQSYPASAGEAWGEVAYLLGDQDHVFALGNDVRAFAIDNLTAPLWTAPPPATSNVGQDRAMDSPSETAMTLRGRAQLAGEYMIVPTQQGMVFLDRETGQTVHRLPIPPGNPVADDAQLVSASSDRIDAYMSFDRAQAMLRDRIDARPDDPAPALSLMRLGIRAGDLGLTLSAADLALRAAQATNDPLRGASAQDDLFALLLNVDEQQMAKTVEESQALYAMLGSVASNPLQRVEYMLAYGKWLEGTNLNQAVEIYQRLMTDAQLADVARRDERLERTAGAWGMSRLQRLISMRGDQVYAAQADYAKLQLDGMIAEGRLDVDPLLKLAREFPFAPAALDATNLAVDRMIDQGRRHEAIGELYNIYHLSERRVAASSLLGRAAQLSLDAGMPREAQTIVQYVRERMGDVTLNGETGPRPASAWSDQIAANAAFPAVARLGKPADQKVRELDGDLLPIANSDSIVDLDTFFITRGTVLSMLENDDLEPRWTVDLDEPAKRLLAHDANGALIWQAPNPPDGRVTLLNPVDGSVKWSTPSIIETLRDESNEMIRASTLSDQLPTGELFDPAESLPVTNGRQVILVRRIGPVLAYDAQTGNALWTVDETLDQVHNVQLSETALVLTGLTRTRKGSTQSNPGLVAIDPATGKVLGRFSTHDNQLAQWVRIAPLGRFVYGTDGGVEAIDIFNGRRAWTNTAYDATETLDGWTLPDRILFQERSRSLRTIALDTGELSDPFDTAVRADQWDPYDIQNVQISHGGIYALYPQRLVRFSDRGRIEGQDVVVDDRMYRWLVPAQDQLIVISGQSMQSVVPDAAGRHFLIYRYRLYIMGRDGKLIGNAYDLDDQESQAETWRAVNGWLLVARENHLTLAVPMPAGNQP